jgi:hypothetical protein
LGTGAHWVFEVAVEMGAPFAILVIMGGVPPCLSSVEAKWRENGNKRCRSRSLCIGLLAAFHSLVDFLLQMSSLSLAISLLTGMEIAQAGSSRDRA